jgi:hypothetical protein
MTATPIFRAGLPNFSWYNMPKRGKTLPDDHKIYHMSIQYANIFHSKAFQKYQSGDFFVNVPYGLFRKNFKK